MKNRLLGASVAIALLFVLVQGCRKTSFWEQEQLAADEPQSSAAHEMMPQEGLAYKPEEVLVEFFGADDAAVISGVKGSVKEKVRTKAMERFNNPGFSIVKVPDVAAAVTALQKNPKVRWASPNYIVQAVQTYPDDPYYTNNSLWGMTNIKASSVWPTNKGSQNVFVGLIDEGIMYWHEDLCGQIWNNPYDLEDGLDNDGNGYVDDIHGWDFMHNDKTIFDNADNHGTHTAGTIGGKGNNGKGVIGVAPNVTIISGKFLEGSGSISDAIRATDYMTDLKTRHGMNVVATSNSWGWGGGSFVQGMYDAVERARLADILFIAAAGNSSVDNDVAKFYPSSMTNANIISVAAITSTDGLASFSCYGDTSVDLGAPGSGIYSTLPGANYTYTYGSYSGTSMATPHVAGAAALYKSLNPGATFTQVKSALMSNARSISSLQGKTVTGGTLDVSFMSGGTVSETPADRACVPPPIDYTAPTVPAQVRTTSITNSSLAVAWDASSDPESGVALYYAYLKWPTGTTTILSTTGTTGTFSNLGPGINYKIYVAAKNGYGLWSTVSDTLFVTTTGTPDAEAPSVPVNFKATGATTTSLSFSWTASTDNVGVSGYQIRWRRAGTTGYSSASFSGTSVTISGLLTATNYEISLRAYDASQNYSAYTTPDLFVGTVGSDLVAPTTPNNLAVTSAMTSAINLTWDTASDNVGIAGYRVYWKTGTNAYVYATTATNAYAKTGLTAGVTYDFYVVAYDAGGNLSGSSNTVTATTLSSDNTPPSKPLNVRSTAVSNSSISLAWDASADPESGIQYYSIYLKWPSGSNSILTTSSLQTTFNNIGSGLNYSVYVIARNTMGLNSISSDTIPVSTTGNPDPTAPTAPANLRSTSIGTTNITMAWDAATDNVAVLGYNIRWKQVGGSTSYSTNLTGLSYNITSGMAAATNYYVSVRSYDASQNYSAWLPDVLVGTSGADQIPPSVPLNLVAGSSTTNSIALSWDASTDNVGVTGYRVYWRTGANAYQYVSVTGTSYTKASLSSGTAYDFYVVAIDAGGNISTPSATVTASTTSPDTQAPASPTGLSVTGATATSLPISWNVPSDNVGVTGYRLYWKASTASTYSGPVTLTTPAYTLNTLSSAVTYNMYVVAFDAAGNSSVPSSVLNATTLDNVPPTAPGGLTVTGSTSSSLSLSWTASADNLSVSGYRVYWKASADASYTNTPITTTSRTLTLSSLLANTSYDIKVEAYDAASNVSSATTVTASTPAATVTPTLSSTLQGTASVNSHTLNWAVASSGVTVSAIQLQVKKDNGAFTLLTSYSAPFNASGSFTNSSLPRGKYTYRVFVTGQSSGTGSAMSAYSNTIVFNVR